MRGLLFTSLLGLAAQLLLPASARAEARFRAGGEGEVASDVELDLAQMPRFTWAMDPFLKVPGLSRLPDISPEQYKLEAVTVQGENPMAVVNGQVVRVGDRISGRIVMRIEKDYVLLGAGGSIVEASLYDEDRAPASVEEPSSPAAGNPAQKASPVSGGQPQKGAEEGSVSIEEVRK